MVHKADVISRLNFLAVTSLLMPINLGALFNNEDHAGLFIIFLVHTITIRCSFGSISYSQT
jgi:hypothetical protein